MIVTYRRSIGSIFATTWQQLLGYLFYALLIIFLYQKTTLREHINLSAAPITILGTAVSFLLTFRTNSAYDRWWEARKLWGSMVNSSRTFGMQVLTLIESSIAPPNTNTQLSQPNHTAADPDQSQLLHRHIAYLNLLRLQLRDQRSLLEEVRPHLTDADWNHISVASNPATQVNLLQAEHLHRIANTGRLAEFSRIAIQSTLGNFYDWQGASERIRNTPFPPLYDFCTKLAFWVFLGILPVSLVDDLGYKTLVVFWGVALIFIETLRVGFIMQNPFSNGANDTPLTAICRTIEIDLRQMLREPNIPPPVLPQKGVLM